MKGWIVLLLLLSGPAGAAAGAEENVMPDIFPYPTHVENLENGLKVVIVPMNSGGLVAYWTIVRTGARDEYEPGHTGFAHFFEHMMFRGTERFPQDVYNGIVTEIGADANAYTSDDLTAYHLSITADDLERVMEIESDRFQNLAYAEPAFRTEAGAVYGEYRKNRMSPFFTIYEAVHRAAFEKHTYGHTAMGFEEDIKRMPEMFDYSRSFFRRYYRPENCVLLITGDVDVAATMQRVHHHYGGWKPGYVSPEIPSEPEQTRERKIDVSYEGQSLPIVWVAYKAGRFDPGDRGWVATRLLASLAFGETSDIHRRLVLDEQVVEFINASVDFQRDPGLLDIVTRVKDPERVDYVLERIDEVVHRYREQLPDEERLAALKSRVRYGFLMRLDTPDHVASSLARIIAVTGGIEAVEVLYRNVETIGRDDVRSAARELLVPTRRTVAVLTGGR